MNVSFFQVQCEMFEKTIDRLSFQDSYNKFKYSSSNTALVYVDSSHAKLTAVVEMTFDFSSPLSYFGKWEICR